MTGVAGGGDHHASGTAGRPLGTPLVSDHVALQYLTSHTTSFKDILAGGGPTL